MPTNQQHMEAEDNAAEPYDSSDPESVKAARKRSGRIKKKERDILAALMSHPDGRYLMFESIRCILTSSTPAVIGDPTATYFNCGQEYRARHLFTEIVRIAPQHFVTMMEEHGKTL